MAFSMVFTVRSFPGGPGLVSTHTDEEALDPRRQRGAGEDVHVAANPSAGGVVSDREAVGVGLHGGAGQVGLLEGAAVEGGEGHRCARDTLHPQRRDVAGGDGDARLALHLQGRHVLARWRGLQAARGHHLGQVLLRVAGEGLLIEGWQRRGRGQQLGVGPQASPTARAARSGVAAFLASAMIVLLRPGRKGRVLRGAPVEVTSGAAEWRPRARCTRRAPPATPTAIRDRTAIFRMPGMCTPAVATAAVTLALTGTSPFVPRMGHAADPLPGQARFPRTSHWGRRAGC